MSEFIFPQDPKPSPSWGVHDPHIFRDPVSKKYYLYCTHGKAYSSPDLIRWTALENVIPVPPQDVIDHTGSRDVWAPDLFYNGSEYRMYASVSTFGSQNSAIFLAVSSSPEGPFEPRGTVLRTVDGDPCNAIDANVIADVKTGEQYLLYGSFWGGIYMRKLDPATGMPLGHPEGVLHRDADAIHLAARPQEHDGAIEGAYMIYHPETEYYYLFVSYGSLNSDYNIRVGRSRKITGPFLDPDGKDLLAEGDRKGEVGHLLIAGYRFEGDRTGFMAPGHNSVLRDFDGSWYLVHHIRPHNFHHFQMSLLHVRRMFWGEDGWPVVSPEPYAGGYPQPVDPSMLCGEWDYMKFRPTIPQGLTTTVKLILKEDGTGMLADSIHAKWHTEHSLASGCHDCTTLVLEYSGWKDRILLMPVWDQENKVPAIAGCGLDAEHRTVWIKQFFEDR
ncbi:MAG: arabinan endo-1,5-alpha-L-arabinosidase [Lachnospiraceae bacterium]|nr:arabinan endo-1,5-alpha-L-arabinosidase [Lachnospiraceae bacterium]